MARRRKTQPKNFLNQAFFPQCFLTLKEKKGYGLKGDLILQCLRQSRSQCEHLSQRSYRKG